MAEYFATPNEVIDLGKNREWMEPSDERGLHMGGVRPPPAEHGHQAHGGKQEVLLMGRVGEDTASAEHPCWEVGLLGQG